MQLSFRDCRHGVKRRRFELSLVLLGRAIDEGSGVLLSQSIAASSGEVELVVRQMLADGLIAEVRVEDMMLTWRVDGEIRYGLRVTRRGLAFVGYPPLQSGLVEEAAA